MLSLYSFDGKTLYSPKKKKNILALYSLPIRNHGCHRNCKNWSHSWHNNRI